MTTDTTDISTATVTTERPGRYAKQLVSHMSRKAQGTWSDKAAEGTITFTDAELTLTTGEGALLLSLSADSESSSAWRTWSDATWCVSAPATS